jgi:hypothetical protein
MGATTFEDYGWGKTPRDAFKTAKEEAYYEVGHGGYTGTIAEKDSYVMIDVPSKWQGREEEYAYHLMNEDDPRIADKWGPAGCILLESRDATEEIPTGVTVSKYKQEGARKWQTVYIIRSLDDRAYYRVEVSQTEAEKVAKDYSKAHNQRMVIDIEKKLMNGNPRIVTVTPKTKVVKSKNAENKYIFFGWASC